jgi:hypothetical protein
MATKKYGDNADGTRSNSAKKRPRGDPRAIEKYRWQKGQSGNPSGRPRKLETLLRQALMARLAEELKQNGEIKTIAEVLAMKITSEAVAGKNVVAAFKAIADVVEPKRLEVDSDGRIEVVYVNDWRESET